MDVKSAFLNGVLNEDIYMEQPQGFIAAGQENKVCRLKKQSMVSNKPPVHGINNFMEFLLNWALNGCTLMQEYM